jgi:hypothetical protein
LRGANGRRCHVERKLVDGGLEQLAAAMRLVERPDLLLLATSCGGEPASLAL